MSETKFATASPSAIAIISPANNPLLIRTSFDHIDKEEATKLIYLMHASLDIIDEKLEQPTRDNFLGTLYQCELHKIYGSMSTTKVKILLMVSHDGYVPRESDARQMLKNIHKAYVEATIMNPFHKPHQPVKSKRLDGFLDSILVHSTIPVPNVSNDEPGAGEQSQLEGLAKKP